jgi:hypothetical protein
LWGWKRDAYTVYHYYSRASSECSATAATATASTAATATAATTTAACSCAMDG